MPVFVVKRWAINFSMGGKSCMGTWHVQAAYEGMVREVLPPDPMGRWTVEPLPTLSVTELASLEHDWVSWDSGTCRRCGFSSTLRPLNPGPCLPT